MLFNNAATCSHTLVPRPHPERSSRVSSAQHALLSNSVAIASSPSATFSPRNSSCGRCAFSFSHHVISIRTSAGRSRLPRRSIARSFNDRRTSNSPSAAEADASSSMEAPDDRQDSPSSCASVDSWRRSHLFRISRCRPSSSL